MITILYPPTQKLMITILAAERGWIKPVAIAKQSGSAANNYQGILYTRESPFNIAT